MTTDKLVDVPSILPEIDGRPVRALDLSLSGNMRLPLDDEDNRKLLDALKLDREVTVAMSVDGAPPFELVASVTKTETKMVKGNLHAGRQIKVDRESTDWSE